MCLVFLYLFAIFCGCSAPSEEITGDMPTKPSPIENEPSSIPSATESPEPSDVDEPPEDFGMMEIFVFDIGKADAILITTENHAVLIDTGEEKHGHEIADYLISKNVNEIDCLIITHFHKDHVGGADTIIRNLTVKEVIVPNYGKESKHYNRFIAAMDEAELNYNALKETVKFTLDNAEFTVYPPWQEYYHYADSVTDEDEDYDSDDENDDVPNENNFSLVVSVNHGNNNFLFTGDAKSKRLKELLMTDSIYYTDYDFLKVPHHGRFNVRGIDFIYTIRPKYAVITCSQDNPADERIIRALEATGAEIFFTLNGNVYCISDGKSLKTEYRGQN
jgi:beta-lactamase superfamily II metal-dependent hydrolase